MTSANASPILALFASEMMDRINKSGALFGPLRQFRRGIARRLDSRLKDYDMRKGFTRKPQADEPATRGKNYITPSGLQRLKEEHRFLLDQGTPGRDEGGDVGCGQRRSQ